MRLARQKLSAVTKRGEPKNSPAKRTSLEVGSMGDGRLDLSVGQIGLSVWGLNLRIQQKGMHRIRSTPEYSNGNTLRASKLSAASKYSESRGLSLSINFSI